VTRLAVVLAALSVLALGAAPVAAAGVTFYGIAPGPTPDARDVQGIAAAKVHTARILINWRAVQPTQNTTNWTPTDRAIGDLAAHGIRPAPFVYGSPKWVRPALARPPIDTAAHQQAWRNFLRATVTRYRPGGTYWTTTFHHQYPRATPLPIQSWQVWSEPNFANFDPGGTVASAAQKYATLLKASAPTIRAADPKAQVVFAGMPGFAQWKAWSFLDEVYEVPGARAYFDVTALQPYATDVDGVGFQMKQFRGSMSRHGDGTTPLWVTEFAWGSGPPDASGHNKGLAGQRQMLINSFNLFLTNRRQWNLQRLYWFLWRDPAAGSDYAKLCPICGTAGLLRHDRTAKPALSAFRSFTAETTPPVVTIISGPAQGSFINDPTPTFQFASNDPSSYVLCHFDSGGFIGCGSPLTRRTPLADGTHSFSVKAIDVAGNESAVKSRSFIVDTVPPQTGITGGPVNGGTTTDHTPTFRFVSNQAGSTFECRFDADVFASCSGPANTHTPAAELTSGTHSFEVRAIDRATNLDPTPAMRTFTVAP
jgi:hypothetical protein